MSLTLRGSCLCGKLSYELSNLSEEDVKKTSLCHCRPCRKISGATNSVNLTVPEAVFSLKTGELKKARTTHPDAGFDFSVGFCENCGSPIFGQPHSPPGAPPIGILVIQVGSLDDTTSLETKPEEEMNINNRLHWIAPISGARQKRTYAE